MEVTDEANQRRSCEVFNFVVCALVIGLVCLIGLAGNITSFLVLLKHKSDTTAIFLLECMALADSMLLLTTVFIYSLPSFYSFTGSLTVVQRLCDAIKVYVWPVAMITHTVTIWLTVLVTWNRFCACCRPIGSYRKLSLPAVRLQVFGVLVLSAIYNMPRFFEHQPIAAGTVAENATGVELVESNVNESSSSRSSLSSSSSSQAMASTTTVNLGDSQIYQIIYSNVIYFPVMYIVPLLSMSYLNVRLIRSLKAIRMKKQTLTGHKPREDHITHCVVVIVICFIVCQTPALVNQIFWAALDNGDRRCGRFHFYYTKLSDTLVVINSSCNFAIYCLFGKSFRKIFLDALCRSNGQRVSNRTQTCLNDLNETDGTTIRKKSAETCETNAV
ncbi:hypothetical protein LSH36_484g01001 [Paralvinella palmiformis]|uniref:G-protein coupled receptors family 1 profile domain-containing protein n=1 Tax=Paralvinella palmiformis TaxID=53620 RepID=A0AAD9JAM4_9ANNE|nr:hypothetical protein LSH36_484g01001 [Paralvinella palmiformis]